MFWCPPGDPEPEPDTVHKELQTFSWDNHRASRRSNGALTPAGDRAVACIRNGLAAGIAAAKTGSPLDLTKGILGFAAPLTGCGGIIDMNKIPTSNEFQFVLRSAVP